MQLQFILEIVRSSGDRIIAEVILGNRRITVAVYRKLRKVAIALHHFKRRKHINDKHDNSKVV